MNTWTWFCSIVSIRDDRCSHKQDTMACWSSSSWIISHWLNANLPPQCVLNCYRIQCVFYWVVGPHTPSVQGKDRIGGWSRGTTLGAVEMLEVMTELTERGLITTALTSSQCWMISADDSVISQQNQRQTDWEIDREKERVMFWKTFFACLLTRVSVCENILWLKPWMSNISHEACSDIPVKAIIYVPYMLPVC